MCIHLGGRLNIYPAGKINRVDAVQSSCKGMAGVIALGLKGHWDAVELNEQGGRKGTVATPEKEKGHGRWQWEGAPQSVGVA